MDIEGNDVVVSIMIDNINPVFANPEAIPKIPIPTRLLSIFMNV